MNIGVLGLSFNAENKGCEALAYSFLVLLNQIAVESNQTFTCYIFTSLPIRKALKFKGIINSSLPRIEYSNLIVKPLFYRTIRGKTIFLSSKVSKLDYVFDYTAGDSFTDIYGKYRFYSRTRIKERIIKKNVPLILGSQTIGPFNDDQVRNTASDVICRCKEVFVRDKMSYDYVKLISGREPILTTDIAFFLPYTPNSIKSGRLKIGINPSGLLWEGGYTKDNQFGLVLDYKEYLIQLIEALLDADKYDIYLIPHATSSNSVDNDLVPIDYLCGKYPQLKPVDEFDTCIEAKSFISGMDVFVGSRMHATIAAVSSGVPVIPVSYSRKFEGLFDSIHYRYVIHSREMSTNDAVAQTLTWLSSINEMAMAVENSLLIVDKLSSKLKEETKKVIGV